MRTIYNSKINPKYGNKANNLITLHQHNFNVPDGIIIPYNIAMKLLDKKSVLWKDIYSEITKFVKPGNKYIVRSSGLNEDGNDSSFAGIYESYPDCETSDDICDAIHKCVMMCEDDRVTNYTHETSENQMSIIVQIQIDCKYAGVIFSTNINEVCDQECLVEYVAGSCDDLVSGYKKPNSTIIAWNQTENHDVPFDVIALKDICLKVANIFNTPIDIEFGIDDNDNLFLFQARPITAFTSTINQGLWTTANFRDGGVSSAVCSPLMFSLYEYSWTGSLGGFLVDNHYYHAITEPLIIQRYGRVYWNVGIVKKAMSKIPGFDEGMFNSELGISSNNLVNTSFNLKNVIKSSRPLLSTISNIYKTINQVDSKLKEFSYLYTKYEYQLIDQNKLTLKEIEKLIEQLLVDSYYDVEKTYFTQAFINTVIMAVEKTKILKKHDEQYFLDLITNIDNISHNKLYDALDSTVKSINYNEAIREYWLTNNVEVIIRDFNDNPSSLNLKPLKQVLADYGYHSRRELNLLEPSYCEDPSFIVSTIKTMLANKELDSNTHTIVNQRAVANKTMKKLKYLLWCREEFKDYSTRFYHLIRQYIRLLGMHYKLLGYIEHIDDLFYLKYQTIIAFINKQIDIDELQHCIEQNKQYVKIYTNGNFPQELYEKTADITSPLDNKNQQGICASNGKVVGKVRVIESLDDLYLIQEHEILVTKFSDTGWSVVYPKISGLITETGGMLCHASLVAREYQIPMLVCVDGACNILKTGMKIELDATNQKISIIEE